jgi:hypothetical protein
VTGDVPLAPRPIEAVACAGPWGIGVEAMLGWLDGDREATLRVPPVPGFIESTFNPLVYHTVKSLLAGAAGAAATGVVLGSELGDTTTSDVASQNLARGRIRNPLLFYQSIPSSILGYLSRELGITGRMSCVSSGTLLADLLEMADLMLADPRTEQVAVIAIELAPNPRTEALLRDGCGSDVAVGLLLRREPVDPRRVVALVGLDRAGPPSGPGGPPPPKPPSPRGGGTWTFVELCRAWHRLREGGGEEVVGGVARLRAAPWTS